jgi:hypothetical protein
VFGHVVNDNLQADHIIPFAEIVEWQDFLQLAFDDQVAVLNLKQNFIGLDGSSNASKNKRRFSQWFAAGGHPRLGVPNQNVMAKLLAVEAEAHRALKAEIAARLGKRR